MEDAQYFSPAIPNFPDNAVVGTWPHEPLFEVESSMEIEPEFYWHGRWEDECMDVEMVDLTELSENLLPTNDFEMYEATEYSWSLDVEEIKATWIPTDIYMVDIWQDDSDYSMSL